MGFFSPDRKDGIKGSDLGKTLKKLDVPHELHDKLKAEFKGHDFIRKEHIVEKLNKLRTTDASKFSDFRVDHIKRGLIGEIESRMKPAEKPMPEMKEIPQIKEVQPPKTEIREPREGLDKAA